MSEYATLERRVVAVEQEVGGGTPVTRHVLEQTRRNSDDLAIIKARVAAHDNRFDQVDARFDRLEGRFDRLETELRVLRGDVPKMTADTLREVLRERKR